METFFLEEEDSFSRPGRFLCWEWKISSQRLDDSFPGTGRFLSRDRKISCCRERVPLFNRSRGSFSFEAEVYSIIFKGPSCQISCKSFFLLAVSLSFDGKSTKRFSSRHFNPFGRPRTVLQTQNVWFVHFFGKKTAFALQTVLPRMRRLEAFWSSSLEIYTPLENSREK